MNNSGDSHQSAIYMVSFARSSATDTAYLRSASAIDVCHVIYPIIVPSIHIPLYVVARSLGSKRLEPVALRDLGTLVVCHLLMFFIMAVIGIDLRCMSRCCTPLPLQLTRFASFPISCLCRLSRGRPGDLGGILLVNQANLQIVELCVAKFLAHVIERMLQFFLEMLWIRPAITWGFCRHD